MSVYFKNRYRCILPGSGTVPIETFYYRADMSPQLRWKTLPTIFYAMRYGGGGAVVTGIWIHIYVFYYMMPYIQETIQVTLPTAESVTRVWDSDTASYVYGSEETIRVIKNISDVQIFGKNAGSITGKGLTHYPRSPDDCLLESIRTDTGSKNFTSTWRAMGGKGWYINEDANMYTWFDEINPGPHWPTNEAIILDGSYIRNGPDDWAVRCSPRSRVFPGNYVRFGGVEGRITSVTESANMSDASIEVTGFHDYIGYKLSGGRRSAGIGDTRTFYGLCKIVAYETYVRYPAINEWSGEWDVYTVYEVGPTIGDPASFMAMDDLTQMLTNYPRLVS